MVGKGFRALMVSGALLALLFHQNQPAIASTPDPVKSKMTLEDISRLDLVTEVVMSPNGHAVAFVRRVGDVPEKGGKGSRASHLAVMGHDGRVRTYVGDENRVWRIGFTHDGNGITFLMKRGKDKFVALYEIPLDGGEAMKVAELKANVVNYSFSPDGKRVALLGQAAQDPARTKMLEKGFTAHVVEESEPLSRVWIVDVAEREGAMGVPKEVPVEGSVSTVAWSPAGNALLVATAPTPSIDDYYLFRTLQVIDLEGKDKPETLVQEGKLGKSAWSPDGLRVASLMGENLTDPSAGRLQVADLQSRTFKDVYPDLGNGDIVDFEWLNAREILAIVARGTETSVEKIQVDQRKAVELIPAEKAIFRNLSVSRIGSRIAFSAHRSAHPPELYTWDAEAGLGRRTHHNAWLEDREMGPQQVVRYKARDGVEIEGILIAPVAQKKGKRYPLILTVHGGPESHYSNGWLTYYSMAGQVGAGEGYAVFYPNYRGSTGRGVTFSRMSQGDPAGREFDDLVDGAEHLIRSGLVQKGKVGITGSSYGGYAAAWGATYYSTHFAASVVHVGLSNLLSKVGTTEIPREMYHSHWGFWPWEKWSEVLLRSPVYYADQSRTPTLVLHGEEDTRVDPGQAKELYRHLKIRGKAPVRLVTYPGEGHGNGKRAAQYDYGVRMMRWFDHFLKKGRRDLPPFEVSLPVSGE